MQSWQGLLEQAANEKTIDFNPSYLATVNRRFCVSLKNYSVCLALRSISTHLSRKFHLKLMNRDEIVLGVIRALNDAGPMYIIRRDISSFYESIPTQPVKDRLLLDTSISQTLLVEFLKQFFEHYCPSNLGIPRGLALSATLAEFSLQDFDHTVQRLPGVYRYFRFSDDILLFCFKSPNETVIAMEAALPPGMQFNQTKSSILPITNLAKDAKEVDFEYLGYRFLFSDAAKGDKPKKVTVSVSNRKIQKLKSRIILSLKRYAKDKNYTLLRDRLRFLSGNYRVRRFGISAVKTTSHIKSGIYYSYRQCGTYAAHKIKPHDCRELKELDGFYFSLLKSTKSQFFWLLKARLSPQQYDELLAISFFRGFEKRMSVRFAAHQVRDIKAAWKNA